MLSSYSHHKYCLAATQDELPRACVFALKLFGMSQQYCLGFKVPITPEFFFG